MVYASSEKDGCCLTWVQYRHCCVQGVAWTVSGMVWTLSGTMIETVVAVPFPWPSFFDPDSYWINAQACDFVGLLLGALNPLGYLGVSRRRTFALSAVSEHFWSWRTIVKTSLGLTSLRSQPWCTHCRSLALKPMSIV